MRERFDKELNEVEDAFIELSDLYQLTFDKLELYSNEGDKSILKEIIDNEPKINAKIDTVGRSCFNLMLRQQPVASDLRFIQVSISLASSFRHIYSHMVEASLILEEINDHKKVLVVTSDYIISLKKMLSNFKQALVDRNEELAYNTVKMDDEIDSLFQKSIDYAIQRERESYISTMELTDFILYFKYFERIGDRLAKINVLLTQL